MKEYVYACLELNLELKNDMIACVKIPFNNDKDAFDYVTSHYDESFYTRYWLE